MASSSTRSGPVEGDGGGLCPAVGQLECSTAKHYQDYYYQPFNSSRTTPVGIAAYRSALTLDWMAAEDSRQRELVAAFEQDPQFPSPLSHSDCISYNRPSAGSVAKLMLEMLKNLEGDEGFLVTHLAQALVRAKLLMLETSMFEHEPDFDALVKTPTAMIGEPHSTFPRVIEVLWMAVTDPSTVKKHGWCTISKMTSFIQASRPVDIAAHMRASEQIISRARFIMEEFIQHVTPLNLEKQTRPTSTETPKESTTLPPLPPTVQYSRMNLKNKRLARTHQEVKMVHQGQNNKNSNSQTTEELETLMKPIKEELKEVEDIKKPSDAVQYETRSGNERRVELTSASSASHQITKFSNALLIFSMLFL